MVFNSSSQRCGTLRERKLRPAIIEKDYYVTEALRFLATTSRDKIIFKGGTSLAKDGT
jgi:predicted nucleotidyltransferase component of viral defense system